MRPTNGTGSPGTERCDAIHSGSACSLGVCNLKTQDRPTWTTVRLTEDHRPGEAAEAWQGIRTWALVSASSDGSDCRPPGSWRLAAACCGLKRLKA